MNRYLCIHGHFYQPPRENPWLEEIELQESAYPYHDWNEKITMECYAPNAASRILGPDRKIINIVNNYARISFNFGPTLLSWMEKHSPEGYQEILKADKESQKLFGGHGSALAQAYNHMIMPLANSRDERTQIIWGIKDFEYRFNRKPEGMWLPETAVNVETLEFMAEFGIKFTILAPHQAARVRKIGTKEWKELKGASIDPKRPYLCPLPSGNSINLFFYDGPISQEIAFQGLLKNGEAFAHRLMGVFPFDQKEARLVHIATDGETYGHHQNFGDMALSFCLHHIESYEQAKVTIYGEFLEKFPPTHEVQIIENTSWSCVHGIDRWKTHCGCHTGMNPTWHQKWRESLRNALDWLRDTTIPLYEQHMRAFCHNPWDARDRYIDIILNRTPERLDAFIKENTFRELDAVEKTQFLRLLELQRHAMLMYTSCGWFFDEISGLESTKVLQYAARLIQLTRQTCDQDLEQNFKKILEMAPSNVKEYANGSQIYDGLVKPKTVTLLRVGIHHAVASIFEEPAEKKKIFCYTVRNNIFDQRNAGRHKLVIGRCTIESDITLAREEVAFAVLYLGDHNLNGGVKLQMDEETFKHMLQEIKKAFSRSDITEILRLMNHYFGMHHYSLKHLFKDRQKEIFSKIIASTLSDLNTHFRRIYEQYYPLLQAKDDLKIILPRALSSSFEFVLNGDLIDLLTQEDLDIGSLERVVEEIKRWSFEIDHKIVSYVASRKITELMNRFRQDPGNLEILERIESLLRILKLLSLELNLWEVQNDYFAVTKEYLNYEKEGGAPPTRWRELFKSLGGYIDVRID